MRDRSSGSVLGVRLRLPVGSACAAADGVAEAGPWSRVETRTGLTGSFGADVLPESDFRGQPKHQSLREPQAGSRSILFVSMDEVLVERASLRRELLLGRIVMIGFIAILLFRELWSVDVQASTVTVTVIASSAVIALTWAWLWA